MPFAELPDELLVHMCAENLVTGVFTAPRIQCKSVQYW